MWTSEPITELHCRPRHGYPESDDPSTMTVLCTLGLIFLTVLLEIVVHLNTEGYFTFNEARQDTEGEIERECNDEASIFSSSSTLVVLDQPQPQPRTSPLACEHSDQGEDTSDLSRHTFCIPHPSPSIRITRLILATLLYTPLLTLFILLMHRFTHVPTSTCYQTHPVQPDLQEYVGVVFFEIIPFICGTFAFLRSLVDVILWKCGQGRGKGKGLSYEFEIGGWWVCMPIIGFVLGVAGCWLGLWRGCERVVKWVIGRRERSKEGDPDEEEMGLMLGMGEGGSGDDREEKEEKVVEERWKEVEVLV